MSEDVLTDCVLHARLESIKNFSQLLKCVQFQETTVCFASSNGLKFVVEDSKCVQAAAFIGEDLFQEYRLTEELIAFRLDLNVLLECLNILDGEASLNLYYKGEGFPLRLVIVEEDTVADVSIKTMDALETLHFSMPQNEVLNKMIVDGPKFKDVMSDLDSDSEFIQILISVDPPYFSATTLSTSGKCEVVLPKEAEMIQEFLPGGRQICRYKRVQFKPAMKTLQCADKVSMQISNEGLLCFQFMVKTPAQKLAYIEYFCTPVITGTDD